MVISRCTVSHRQIYVWSRIIHHANVAGSEFSGWQRKVDMLWVVYIHEQHSCNKHPALLKILGKSQSKMSLDIISVKLIAFFSWRWAADGDPSSLNCVRYSQPRKLGCAIKSARKLVDNRRHHFKSLNTAFRAYIPTVNAIICVGILKGSRTRYQSAPMTYMHSILLELAYISHS